MDVQGMKSRHTLLKEYAYTRGDIDRGYNNRTLYVNLSENSVAEKPVSEEMKEKFIERDHHLSRPCGRHHPVFRVW